MSFTRDVVIVGGCGRVGLPLGLVLADAGLSVTLYDVNPNAVDQVRAGKMPFWEQGADDLLERMISTDRLDATVDPKSVVRGRARRAGGRHAGRRAPQPRPEVRAARDRGPARSAARRSAPDPAQHRVPRCHRDGREAARRGQAHDRRVVLSRADRGRARRSRSSAHCRRSCPVDPSARCDAPMRSSPGSRRRSCTSHPKRPSWRSCSRTRGATSSSRPRTSCS